MGMRIDLPPLHSLVLDLRIGLITERILVARRHSILLGRLLLPSRLRVNVGDGLGLQGHSLENHIDNSLGRGGCERARRERGKKTRDSDRYVCVQKNP